MVQQVKALPIKFSARIRTEEGKNQPLQVVLYHHMRTTVFHTYTHSHTYIYTHITHTYTYIYTQRHVHIHTLNIKHQKIKMSSSKKKTHIWSICMCLLLQLVPCSFTYAVSFVLTSGEVYGFWKRILDSGKVGKAYDGNQKQLTSTFIYNLTVQQPNNVKA